METSDGGEKYKQVAAKFTTPRYVTCPIVLCFHVCCGPGGGGVHIYWYLAVFTEGETGQGAEFMATRAVSERFLGKK